MTKWLAETSEEELVWVSAVVVEGVREQGGSEGHPRSRDGAAVLIVEAPLPLSFHQAYEKAPLHSQYLSLLSKSSLESLIHTQGCVLQSSKSFSNQSS